MSLSADKLPLHEPPPNPLGGKTLIVDSTKPECFARPSEALNQAESADQIFICPGMYEDRLVVTERPIYLIGAGRDQVTIFSRRSGPCYLQRVSGGQMSGITFRYVGSDQHSAHEYFGFDLYDFTLSGDGRPIVRCGDLRP